MLINFATLFMTWLDCVGMCLWQRLAGLLVKKTNIAFFIDVQIEV